MGFTLFDIIIAIILVVSGLLALMRGFTREFLAVFSWVAGIGMGVYYYRWNPFLYEQIKPYAEKYTDNIIVINGATAVVLGLLVLIILSILLSRFSESVLNSGVSALDRTLGFIFGVLRGFVLVVCAYLLFIAILPNPKDHPDGLKSAKLLPAVKQAGELTVPYIAKFSEDIAKKLSDSLDGKMGRSSNYDSNTSVIEG